MIYSPKQADVLLNANARWNILHGSVRSGKTHISYDLILKRIMELLDGPRYLIGKTERTLERNILAPMRERYGGKYVSNVMGKDASVYIFGKKFYAVGANDERAITKIQGAGMVYAYGDEVTTWPQSFFQMLKSRLDKPGAKFDGTCNPEGPYHWLKTDILDKKGVLDVKDFHFELDDGKYFLSPEFIENLKKEYTGVWYKRYVLGLWVMAEGSIYDMWDDNVHVIDKLTDIPVFKEIKEEDIHADWWGASIDAATSSVCTFGLYGVRGEISWQEKEYYYDAVKRGRQKTDQQYAQDFADFVNGYNVRSIYVDPAASSLRAALKAAGFVQVRNANNDVLAGIQTCSRRLQNREHFVRRCCKETIREKASYVWDKKQQDKGEDVPLKKDDHCSDRDRYFQHSVFGRSKLMALGSL
jgi:PBSX family phage terminase large subunit